MCTERMAVALIRGFQNLELNSLLSLTEKGKRKSRRINKKFLEKVRDRFKYFFLLN